jgi:CheY-like chemotaxis protein
VKNEIRRIPMSESDELPEKIKTIVVVEDDADIGEFLVQLLKDETAHQVLLAADGFQALKVVRDIKPDLFVLDYQLPSMDGIELYDHLQTIEALKDIPTLFMSAEVPREELNKRHVSFIEKPFEPDEMIKIVRTLLHE